MELIAQIRKLRDRVIEQGGKPSRVFMSSRTERELRKLYKGIGPVNRVEGLAVVISGSMLDDALIVG